VEYFDEIFLRYCNCYIDRCSGGSRKLSEEKYLIILLRQDKHSESILSYVFKQAYDKTAILKYEILIVIIDPFYS